MGGAPDVSEAVEEPPSRTRFWTVVAAVEALLVIAAVLVDAIVPTIVILLLAFASLAYHREGFRSLGFTRPDRPGRMAVTVLGIVVAWTAFEVGLVMPVLERLAGEEQDVSMFDDLEGNLGMLLGFLLLTWTLAAVGEETAYRGFLQTRATEVFGVGRWGVAGAVGLTAVMFGLAHTEQGVVGVCLAFIDALLFSWLRLHYRTMWAPILAHGFSNTIGLTTFYLVGPITGLW